MEHVYRIFILYHMSRMNITGYKGQFASFFRTYPEVLPVEAGDLRVGGPNPVKVRQERIHIVQALDPFIEGRHDCFSMLSQFHTRRLLFFRFQIPEFCEHI